MADVFKNGGPAFPSPDVYHPNGQVEYGALGMSLRDYFAAKALMGIIAHPQGKAGHWYEAAVDAYDAADAMLKAREE